LESKKFNEKIISEFKKRRTRQIIAIIPAIIAFLGLVSVEDNPAGIFGIQPNTIIGISIALILSVLIFSWFNWRCPSCNKYLGKAWNQKFCSKCGTQLK